MAQHGDSEGTCGEEVILGASGRVLGGGAWAREQEFGKDPAFYGPAQDLATCT